MKQKPKQRLEKYSERFDNDESAIGNPETWGRRLVEDKQETIEEAAKNHSNQTIRDDSKKSFIEGAKWQQERSYSEEDLNKHVIEFLEWRQNYFSIYHGNKNRGLYYARNTYNSLYYNEDRHTALTRKYYNLHELLELFNKFKNK
jgi:hypothetical protein